MIEEIKTKNEKGNLIIVYKSQNLTRGSSSLEGLPRYSINTGSVNYIDENTFKVVSSDEILIRV